MVENKEAGRGGRVVLDQETTFPRQPTKIDSFGHFGSGRSSTVADVKKKQEKP